MLNVFRCKNVDVASKSLKLFNILHDYCFRGLEFRKVTFWRKFGNL